MRAPVLLIVSLAALAAWAAPAPAAQPPAREEVVVTLSAPPLARAVHASKALRPSIAHGRLDLTSPTSRGYLAELARLQRRLESRIVTAVPDARVVRRFRVVVDGLAVSVPPASLARLQAIKGVAHVVRGGVYAPRLDQSPEVIGANALWSLPSLSTAGNGIKIGIIDTGVDPRLPFFNPAGYAYPAGFPKGNRDWTSPKVIVARGFAPPGSTWRYARSPYDPLNSDHGDHVAGIAAGNYATPSIDGRLLSGVAPRAYLGNYKVLSTPTEEFGLIENSTEVVAAIEAAVRDGMDIINLSLGEYEVTPARNIVDGAIDAAADAGVVPVSAAGNSFEELGRGSVGSPGSAAKGISVGAATKSDRLAPWSSQGPTPLSLRLKPDVTAPGVSILSSVPAREDSWASFSGTSMASPHVAGGAALLLQRHPDWTVAQIKSALVLTGRPVLGNGTEEVPTVAEGGGMINLPAANEPLLFTSPASVSFGLLRPGATRTARLDVADAGGGVGTWTVSVDLQQSGSGVKLATPASVDVPGRLDLDLRADASAPERDVTGFVVLRRGATMRRIPFWTRVERPRLGAPARTLTHTGRYVGNAANGKARVRSYRYPDDPSGSGVSNNLPGPEQVFRVRVGRNVANVGVRVISQGKGVAVTPRIVLAGDENRLAGVSALPIDVNPYRDFTGERRPISAALVPLPGLYDVVFDTTSRKTAGRFTFWLWLDDKTPPRARLLTPSIGRGQKLVVAVTDKGSGVDPHSLRAVIAGRRYPVKLVGGKARITIDVPLAAGRHTLTFIASDYQETKNAESTPGVLPNTTVLRRTFRVR